MQRKVDRLNNVEKDSPSGKKEGGEKPSWWKDKDMEARRWFLYTALVVIAITAVYVTPDKYSGYRFQIGGWIILAGLHLIIWPFFTEKTGLFTKVLITCFGLFFIFAVVTPNAIQKEVANVQGAIRNYDENYGKASVPNEAKQQKSSHAIATANRPATKALQQVVEVTPGGIFRKADLPGGVVVENISWDCSQGCIVEIEHDGSPMCTTGYYQKAQCASLVVEYKHNNIMRYREQFVELPGVKPEYPNNLVNVIFSFGTDEGFGPVRINVNSIISS